MYIYIHTYNIRSSQTQPEFSESCDGLDVRIDTNSILEPKPRVLVCIYINIYIYIYMYVYIYTYIYIFPNFVVGCKRYLFVHYLPPFFRA